ncbi:hypothetical protein [Senegalia massiliensis]|uniref:Uncharacterized protein n=1 Tax=Senegalia massiliensis TaxID=1720316 RepID=A0A845R510_9CLOT|nr:hypothetical protein [Senegalia massiliensis]NBI07593.1 hypothetical protein [Senegalia massiliensis]
MGTNVIFIALGITTAIYITNQIIIKNYKKYKYKIIQKQELKKLSEENNESIEVTNEKVTNKKLAELMELEKESITIDERITLNRGDRISFNSEKYGFVSGIFLGARESSCKGYSDMLIIKYEKGKLIQAPLEYINIDSIMVYGR